MLGSHDNRLRDVGQAQGNLKNEAVLLHEVLPWHFLMGEKSFWMKNQQ